MANRNAQSQKCARKRMLDKYGKVCQSCGRKGYVELHHIVAIKDGGTQKDDNLTLLCDTCHRKAHGIKERRPGVAMWVEWEKG